MNTEKKVNYDLNGKKLNGFLYILSVWIDCCNSRKEWKNDDDEIDLIETLEFIFRFQVCCLWCKKKTKFFLQNSFSNFFLFITKKKSFYPWILCHVFFCCFVFRQNIQFVDIYINIRFGSKIFFVLFCFALLYNNNTTELWNVKKNVGALFAYEKKTCLLMWCKYHGVCVCVGVFVLNWLIAKSIMVIISFVQVNVKRIKKHWFFFLSLFWLE